MLVQFIFFWHFGVTELIWVYVKIEYSSAVGWEAWAMLYITLLFMNTLKNPGLVVSFIWYVFCFQRVYPFIISLCIKPLFILVLMTAGCLVILIVTLPLCNLTSVETYFTESSAKRRHLPVLFYLLGRRYVQNSFLTKNDQIYIR